MDKQDQNEVKSELEGILDGLWGATKKVPSRELSLAITNIQQGLMWLNLARNADEDNPNQIQG